MLTNVVSAMKVKRPQISPRSPAPAWPPHEHPASSPPPPHRPRTRPTHSSPPLALHARRSRRYRRVALILPHGHANDEVFVIESGEVEVIRHIGRRPPQVLLSLGRGSYFGALELPPEKTGLLMPAIISKRATDDRDGCTLLRVRRQELAQRSNRAVLRNLALGEAEAWIHRVSSSGKYRTSTFEPKSGPVPPANRRARPTSRARATSRRALRRLWPWRSIHALRLR